MLKKYKARPCKGIFLKYKKSTLHLKFYRIFIILRTTCALEVEVGSGAPSANNIKFNMFVCDASTPILLMNFALYFYVLLLHTVKRYLI